MPLKFDINADEILSQFTEMKEEIKKNMEDSVRNLATLTRARIVEQVEVLSSATNRIYMEALGNEEEVATNVWVITLDQKALWIEEGIQANKDMKPDLLKGKPYAIIPFRYDKPESQNTPFTQGLIGEIKQKLKVENTKRSKAGQSSIDLKKLEKNKDGSVKIGKLHDLNLGGPIPGRGNTPALNRLSIYQNQQKDSSKIRRDVLTFRTVSSGPASDGKWIHPGYEGKKFMDKAMEKAVKDWEEQILPEILAKWGSK